MSKKPVRSVLYQKLVMRVKLFDQCIYTAEDIVFHLLQGKVKNIKSIEWALDLDDEEFGEVYENACNVLDLNNEVA